MSCQSQPNVPANTSHRLHFGTTEKVMMQSFISFLLTKTGLLFILYCRFHKSTGLQLHFSNLEKYLPCIYVPSVCLCICVCIVWVSENLIRSGLPFYTGIPIFFPCFIYVNWYVQYVCPGKARVDCICSILGDITEEAQNGVDRLPILQQYFGLFFSRKFSLQCLVGSDQFTSSIFCQLLLPYLIWSHFGLFC